MTKIKDSFLKSCTNGTYGYQIRIENTVSNTCMLITSYCYYMYSISRFFPISLQRRYTYMKTTTHVCFPNQTFGY